MADAGRRRIAWLANLRKWFGATSTELLRCATNKIRIDDSQLKIEEEEKYTGCLI